MLNPRHVTSNIHFIGRDLVLRDGTFAKLEAEDSRENAALRRDTDWTLRFSMKMALPPAHEVIAVTR